MYLKITYLPQEKQIEPILIICRTFKFSFQAANELIVRCVGIANVNQSDIYSLTQIGFSCAIDHYPGVVIVSDDHYQITYCTSVYNLEKELPDLLKNLVGNPVAHWRVIPDKSEALQVVASLTSQPLFVG